MKVWDVIHYYDEDGGFGDAVETNEIIATFEDENDANAFRDKYTNEHVYDTPYADLYSGRLEVVGKEIIPHKEIDIEKLGFELLYGNPFFRDAFKKEDIRRGVLFRDGKPISCDTETVIDDYVSIQEACGTDWWDAYAYAKEHVDELVAKRIEAVTEKATEEEYPTVYSDSEEGV